MKSRLPAYDFLRSLAIIIILFHHLPEYTFNFYKFTIYGFHVDLTVINEINRYIGLGMFVFISGYLSSIKKRRFFSFKELSTYLLSKIRRIYPLYWVALLLFCYMYGIDNYVVIIAHLIGIQLFFCKYFMPISTLWFVGLTMTYYCIYTTCNIKISPVSVRWYILLYILFYAAIFMLSVMFGLVDDRVLIYYFPFLLGVMDAEYAIISKINYRVILFFCVVFFSILIFFTEMDFYVKPMKNSIYFINIQFLICVSIVLLVRIANFVSLFTVSHRLLYFIANASFSVFLFHRPFFYFLNNISKKFQQLGFIYHDPLFFILIAIPSIILIGYCVQYAYDEINWRLSF